MKSPHPGDFNQPSEPVFRNIERQSPTSLSREDPHTYNRDERGRSRVAHEAEGKPRRKPQASKSRSRSSGSASRRLGTNSRPRSKMRRESKGRPDYRPWLTSRSEVRELTEKRRLTHRFGWEV
ncbi:hypothetical protein TSTA_098910 [Talaromyces stipitatus ATCC 10500]|uniref:Uncharacterized protein n=1 Tax=Talaromyces stipitatus (strain ATCC 10500 / CBS 375.48 / QM 6759 / NRRL 1006) TaxID=441959 RepID=B8MLR4_TALSN|nr:uncharacterized protein TSTA_098910 [Talaromyces stipitatus ATCC 10500]EED13636.1 hypothetical protein TSTA_098910 [Talaromyces stipitatus ATCC 10500]